MRDYDPMRGSCQRSDHGAEVAYLPHGLAVMLADGGTRVRHLPLSRCQPGPFGEVASVLTGTRTLSALGLIGLDLIGLDLALALRNTLEKLISGVLRDLREPHDRGGIIIVEELLADPEPLGILTGPTRPRCQGAGRVPASRGGVR